MYVSYLSNWNTSSLTGQIKQIEYVSLCLRKSYKQISVINNGSLDQFWKSLLVAALSWDVAFFWWIKLW